MTTTAIGPNAYVTRVTVQIAQGPTNSYSPGANFTIGWAGSPNILFDSSQYPAGALNAGKEYDIDCLIPTGASPEQILFTLTGSPSQGSGLVAVFYGVPNT